MPRMLTHRWLVDRESQALVAGPTGVQRSLRHWQVFRDLAYPVRLEHTPLERGAWSQEGLLLLCYDV